MGSVENKIDGLLVWERAKFIKFAQYGLIILVIGIVITRMITILNSFDYGRADEALDVVFKLIQIMGIIVFYIGVLLFLLSLFSIAIHDEELHIYLRVALIIAIGLIVSIPLYSSAIVI